MLLLFTFTICLGSDFLKMLLEMNGTTDLPKSWDLEADASWTDVYDDAVKMERLSGSVVSLWI